jgi:hypothetical protein
MKTRIVRWIRTVVIGAAVLLIVIVGGGVAYTWYMGEHSTPAPVAAAEPTDKVTVQAVPQRYQPAPNAKVGASVQSLSSPATPGEDVSMTVKTNPGATCTIKVMYDKQPSRDARLAEPVTADEYGVVRWEWTIESSVPLGKWPVDVTCAIDKQSAMVRGDLVIKR